ncbi:MAG: hypothetical protein KatS3mg129_2053 [Leptospiraceae bacterium]|nr:MAG: hypothetical protein KatS3mg129_2053 [Leptospiraceae bacterium]
MKQLKKTKNILILLVISSLWQCSLFNKTEKDKTAENFLIFSLLQSSLCTLNGESFIVSGEINCSNNEASATGKLIATSEKEVVSLEITGTLNDNTSEIKIIGGADDNLNGSGFRFGVNIAKAFHPDGTSGGVDMTTGFAPSSGNFTHCLEIHTDETPPHLVAWKNNCPSSGQSSADYDSESNNDPGGTSGKKGNRWGIELKNAKIKIKINTQTIFSH